MRFGGLICAAVLTITVEAGAADALTPGIHPAAPLVERSAFGDSFNFDVLVENKTAKPLYMGSIEVAYLDAGGAELYARTIDYFGRGLETIPDPTLKPQTSRIFYNPFPIVPPDVKPARVKVRVQLYEPPEPRQENLTLVTTQEFTATLADRATPQLTLPIKGRIQVWDGHDLTSHHRRRNYAHPAFRSYGITAIASRYSYDFVVVDDQNRRKTGEGEVNENNFTFGVPVYAPYEGKVVELEGKEADNKKFDDERAKTNANTNFGNYIVIDHGDGLFSVLGHLKQGSLKVKRGDRVKAGQHLASAGASGSSLFAHLHYQLMDGRDTATAEGIPSYFKDIVKLRGSERVPVNGTSIDSGDIVTTK